MNYGRKFTENVTFFLDKWITPVNFCLKPAYLNAKYVVLGTKPVLLDVAWNLCCSKTTCCAI